MCWGLFMLMFLIGVFMCVKKRALFFTHINTPIRNINMKRPQHITITSIKYLISYPINMKVSNQVFTTSNSNKCVGGLCLCVSVSCARATLTSSKHKLGLDISRCLGKCEC